MMVSIETKETNYHIRDDILILNKLPKIIFNLFKS